MNKRPKRTKHTGKKEIGDNRNKVWRRRKLFTKVMEDIVFMKPEQNAIKRNVQRTKSI